MSKYPSIGNGAADSRRPNQCRIRVEVVRRAYQPRQRQHVPPWLVALLIIAAVMWISPFGAVVTIVMIAVLVTSHPTEALCVAGSIGLVIVIGVSQRLRGQPF
jgi:hypothetical protein